MEEINIKTLLPVGEKLKPLLSKSETVRKSL